MRHDGLARPAGLAPSDIAEILGLLPADMTIHLIKEARQAVGRRQVFRVSVPGRTSLIVKSEPAVSEAEFAHVVENYQALSAALGETGGEPDRAAAALPGRRARAGHGVCFRLDGLCPA